MWITQPLDIAVQRNSVFAAGVQLVDEDDETPLDITGLTLSGVVAMAEGQPGITNIQFTDIDAQFGYFTMILDGEGLVSVPGEMEKVTLAYEVSATSGSLNYIIMHGSVFLTRGIS